MFALSVNLIRECSQNTAGSLTLVPLLLPSGNGLKCFLSFCPDKFKKTVKITAETVRLTYFSSSLSISYPEYSSPLASGWLPLDSLESDLFIWKFPLDLNAAIHCTWLVTPALLTYPLFPKNNKNCGKKN